MPREIKQDREGTESPIIVGLTVSQMLCSERLAMPRSIVGLIKATIAFLDLIKT
jgi:hypothetical protein